MLVLAIGIRLSILAYLCYMLHTGFCNDTIWQYEFAAASRVHWIQSADGFVRCKRMPCKQLHEPTQNLTQLLKRLPSYMT